MRALILHAAVVVCFGVMVSATVAVAQPPSDSPLRGVVALALDGGQLCSGVVIAPRVVLTAGHCSAARAVILGDRLDEPEAILKVVARRRHPSIDIGLVRVGSKIGVEPLALRDADEAQPPRGMLRHVGFGTIDFRHFTAPGRKHVRDFLVSGWSCAAPDAPLYGCLPDVEMTVPTSGAADTCLGDSGGPLLERAQGWRIVALTSRSMLGRAPCGHGGIYVRVDVMRTWIDQMLTDLEETP